MVKNKKSRIALGSGFARDVKQALRVGKKITKQKTPKIKRKSKRR